VSIGFTPVWGPCDPSWRERKNDDSGSSGTKWEQVGRGSEGEAEGVGREEAESVCHNFKACER